MLATALAPELLTAFAPLNLLTQGVDNFEPGRFDRVVAGFSVDVRSGHGQRDERAEGRCFVPPMFQHHRDGTN